MLREPDEGADLDLVKQLVFDRPCLRLDRNSRAETLLGRTPDFKVLQRGELRAFCEIKSPRDDWLDEQLNKAPAGAIVGGLRNDPTFNRIARHVKKAASQFDAVNGNHAFPNVLVFVNHADEGGISDLVEALTGVVRTESGEVISTMKHIAEGRIGRARSRIDLYVWIDGRAHRAWYRFNDHNPHQVGLLCRVLGIQRSEIRR